MNKVTFNVDRCKGCSLCVQACPKGIIELDKGAINAKGHHPAYVTEQEKCIACAFCAMMCPDCIITVEKEDKAGAAGTAANAKESKAGAAASAASGSCKINTAKKTNKE